MGACTCVYRVRVLIRFGIVTGTEWRTRMLVYRPLQSSYSTVQISKQTSLSEGWDVFTYSRWRV